MLFFSFSLFFFLLAAALEGWLSSRCCCCRIGCCSGGPLHRRRGFQKQILLPLSSLSLYLSVSLSLLLSSSSFYTLPFRFPRRLCTAANARHPQRTPHRLKPHGGKTRGRNRRIHQHFTVRSFTAPSPAHTHTLTH